MAGHCPAHPRLVRCGGEESRCLETPTEVEFPNGESYATLRRRALEAVASIREAAPAGTAAIVTHGGVVRAILADCLGMPDEAIFRLRQDYCAVSVLEWIEDVPLVGPVNARVGDGAPALSMRD